MGSFTKFFGTVRPKVFDGETWYPSLWCIKFFDTRSFPIHRSAPQRNFSVLWDKKVAMEKRDPPFSSIKPFETRTFIKKSRISWQNFAALWDIKISTENRGTLSYTWKFSIKKVSGTPKWSPTEYFGTVRQKLFDGKSWYLPPLIHKTFFPTRTFVKHRMVPWRSFFGPVR